MVDIDGDGAEQADVVAVRRGDVGEQLLVDAPAAAAELIDGHAEVLRGPGGDRVGGDGQAPGLLGLGLQVPAAYGAFVGVEHVPAQRVHALALVELAGDLAAVVLPGQVAGGVDGTTQRPYSLSAAARL